MSQTLNDWAKWAQAQQTTTTGSASFGGTQPLYTTTGQQYINSSYLASLPSYPHATPARSAADKMVDRMEKVEAQRAAESQQRINRFRELCTRYAAEKLSELFGEKHAEALTAEEETELKGLAAAVLLIAGPDEEQEQPHVNILRKMYGVQTVDASGRLI